MAPEKEDRVFKGIRLTNISIAISCGILLCAVIGIGSKILLATTDLLVQLKLNTTCAAQAVQDVKELNTKVDHNYSELSSRIDNRKDKNYQYLLPVYK